MIKRMVVMLAVACLLYDRREGTDGPFGPEGSRRDDD